MITRNRFLLKRRHDQRALLFVLRTVHSSESVAKALLRRIPRAPNELSRRAKCRRIAQHLSIKFRTNCQKLNAVRLAKRLQRQRHQPPVTPGHISHAAYRIAKKMQVFTDRGGAG